MLLDQDVDHSPKKRSYVKLGPSSSSESENDEDEEAAFARMAEKSKHLRKTRRASSPTEQVWIDLEAEGGPTETRVPVAKKEVPVIEIDDGPPGVEVAGGLATAEEEDENGFMV